MFNTTPKVSALARSTNSAAVIRSLIDLVCGKDGTIIHIFTDELGNHYNVIRFDDYPNMPPIAFTDEFIGPESQDDIRVFSQITPKKDVVEVYLFEGNRELASGIGKIREDSLQGIAQAASFASKQLYRSVLGERSPTVVGQKW